MSSQSVHNINIDDSDVDDVEYQTADLWEHHRDQPSFQGGTYSAGLTNAQAQFRFNGTSVVVYGVATPRPTTNATAIPPAVSFVLDGGVPITVVSNPELAATEYAHAFYDSRVLRGGAHVLQVTVQYAAGDWPFVLDYIQYAPLPPPPPPGEAPTQGGLGASAGGEKGKGSAGAVAGGVVAGVLVLVVAVLVRWVMVKRAPGKVRARGSYIYTAPGGKIDLLDQEPKVPPRAFAASTTDLESLYSSQDGRPSTPGVESHMTSPAPYQHAFSDIESHTGSRPASPSFHRPGTPTTSLSSHTNTHTLGTTTALGLATQRPASAPLTIFNRPGTPSSGYQQPILTPPAALRRSSLQPPAILHRPATPDSSVLSELGPTPASGSRPQSRAIVKQAEEEARLKRAMFHSDSGVRFREGGALPVQLAPVVPETETEEETARQKREKEKRVSFGGSAISEVPPRYTVE